MTKQTLIGRNRGDERVTAALMGHGETDCRRCLAHFQDRDCRFDPAFAAVGADTLQQRSVGLVSEEIVNAALPEP